MKTLLVLSFFPAFLPPRSGGEARLFGLYNALSQTHRVVLLTSGHLGGAVEELRHNANFREVRVPKGPEFSAKWAELQSHAGGGDLSAPCLAALSSTYSELHRRYLAEYADCDVIVHDSPFLSGYDLFLGHDKKPRIYNSYNVELDIYEQLHREAKDTVIRDIVRECESRLLDHVDLVTACSQEDIAGFAQTYGFAGPVRLVPNGIDDFVPPEVAVSGKSVVFIGSGHRPNVLAAEFIATQLAPALPEYDFHIVGTCLAPERSQGNLIVHGPVDDATKDRLFRTARASVNPMVDGGGSSLKIVDLAAAGVPVISTALGVRGFDFVAGKHFLSLTEGREVEDLRRYLKDDSLRAQVATRAADHVKSRFTWNVIAADMADAVQLVCQRELVRPCFTVLNDYDPFLTVGGGATRIRGLYEAVSLDASIILLCFTDEDQLVRREECDGRVLLIAIPKSAEHRASELQSRARHHVSVVDVLAIRAAPENACLAEIADCAAGLSDLVICEHPYMVALARQSGARFVYSSQNFELQLKRDLLHGHPQYDELMEDLTWAESFAVGCSELVVAVSQDDARALGAAFPLTAPVVVVPNGAAEPKPVSEGLEPLPGLNLAFVGSAHMPNIEAARYIVDVLAPGHREATFHILGSACLAVGDSVPANVVLWGVIDEQTKADVLARCDLALNPMRSGSGSNVKVADYLKNGLAVLSTPFGARGYEEQVGADLILRDLDGFSPYIASLALLPEGRTGENAKRRAGYDGKLSMFAWGKVLAGHLHDKLVDRRRIAFVTYRYTDPPLGGAEVHLQRLVEGLAEARHDVDVITTSATGIFDRNRFEGQFDSTVAAPIPVGNARIRTARFPLGAAHNPASDKLWAMQPHFERALHLTFAGHAHATGLAWGWSAAEAGARWCHSLFGIYTSAGDRLDLSGHVPGQRLLRLTCQSGVLLGQWLIEGDFTLAVVAKAACVHGQIYAVDSDRLDDPRPLGAYIRSVAVGGQDLTLSEVLKPWPVGTDEDVILSAYATAASSTRGAADLSLTAVRGPHSPALERYLERCLPQYDLLLTHNAVFRTTTRAIELAQQAGIPSVLVPLLHLDDDYYHFPDVYRACEQADLTLVAPKAACRFLQQIAGKKVKSHTPGVDLMDVPGPDDLVRFRELYPHQEPFFLVLGRKSAAKRYRDVIGAAASLSKVRQVRVVMIGPDEDGEPVTEPFVSVLGQVDRAVVRGALAACTALVNMSVSESFGMVLVEAGHACVPVLASRDCASFHDIVTDNYNGRLVTAETLPAAMADLLDHPVERERLGRNGADQAGQFAWDRIIDAFVDDCESLMSKAGT